MLYIREGDMAPKVRFSRIYSEGTTTHQALLLQMVEKGGRRKYPKQLAREMVLLSMAGSVFLLVVMLLLTVAL